MDDARAFTKYGFAYSVIEPAPGKTARPPAHVYARFCVFVCSSRSSRHQLPWYPNFMLCEPVTYDAVKVQFAPSVWLINQLCARYAIRPVSPGAIVVATSVTRTRSRVGLGTSSRSPHW